MKKVLAAVMAVAMAASMSAVAFATDYQNNGTWYDESTGSNTSAKGDDQLTIGKEQKYNVRIESIDLRDGDSHDFQTNVLAGMMEDNLLSASVVVTSGKDKLADLPTVKVVGETAQLKVKFKDTYDTKSVSAKFRARFTAKKDIYIAESQEGYISFNYVGSSSPTLYLAKKVKVGDIPKAIGPTNIGDFTTQDINDALRLNDRQKDDYIEALDDRSNSYIEGFDFTPESTVTIYTSDDDALNANKILNKGDTMTCPEFEVTGEYLDVTDYGDTLTVTPKEVDDRYIIARGEDLYDNAGSGDKVTIYFGSTGDVAALNFKVSSAQKDLNLFYKTDEVEDVTDAYSDVDFEFITFYAQQSGANVLTNSGSMTFNAIGGKNTTVYEWNGKTLTELNSKYDSVDDTVVVDGIKRLTTYVVSEKKLEAKVEETEAPATETQAPVTEPISAPEPSAPADNNENPNTGAL